MFAEFPTSSQTAANTAMSVADSAIATCSGRSYTRSSLSACVQHSFGNHWSCQRQAGWSKMWSAVAFGSYTGSPEATAISGQVTTSIGSVPASLSCTSMCRADEYHLFNCLATCPCTAHVCAAECCRQQASGSQQSSSADGPIAVTDSHQCKGEDALRYGKHNSCCSKCREELGQPPT